MRRMRYVWGNGAWLDWARLPGASDRCRIDMEAEMAKTETAAVVTVAMKRAKETKRTIVFEAESAVTACNSVYVNKGAGFDDAQEIEVSFKRVG